MYHCIKKKMIQLQIQLTTLDQSDERKKSFAQNGLLNKKVYPVP